MKRYLTRLIFAGLSAGAIAADVACTGSPYLEDQPCPCVEGWVCCPESTEEDAKSYCQRGYSCGGKKKASSSDDDTATTTKPTTTADPSVKTLAQGESPTCIMTDPQSVFWMNDDGSIAGGSTVATTPRVVRARSNLPLTTTVSSCSMLAGLDGLFVSTPEADAIYWLSLSYSTTTPIIGTRLERIADAHHPTALAQDETYLYFLEGLTGELRRLERTTKGPDAGAPGDGGVSAGGPPSSGTLLGTGATGAHSLIVDGDTLYWFDSVGLRRMPKVGGAVTTIATTESVDGGRKPARNVRAAAGSLYWLEDNQLMTVPMGGGAPRRVIEFAVYSFAVSPKGLVLALDTNVGLLGFQGGDYPRSAFSFPRPSASKLGLEAILFDTRYVWIDGEGKNISFRPSLVSDPGDP